MDAVTLAAANAAAAKRYSKIGHFPGTAEIGLSVTKLGAIIQPGAAGSFDEVIAESFTPFFDPVSQRYGIVYTGYANDGAGNPVNGKMGLAWAYHPEGPWTKDPAAPILGGSGNAGDPDQYGITACTMWPVADSTSPSGYTYYAIYDGMSSSGAYEASPIQLCVATATSITGPWTRHGAIISPVASTWYGGDIFHPCLVKRPGDPLWYLFFNASNNLTTSRVEQIGYATASSILGPWTVNPTVLVTEGAAGSWKEKRVGDPSIFRVDDIWWMAYYATDHNDTHTYEGLAWTSDAQFPTGWTDHVANPVMSPTTGSSVDATGAGKSGILQVGGNVYHFYTGTGGFPGHQGALAVSGNPSNLRATLGASQTFTGVNTFNPPIPAGATDQASLKVGDSFAPGLTANSKKILLGSASSDTFIATGQGNTANVYLGWKYNSTVGSAYAQLGCYGTTNRLEIQNSGNEVMLGGSTGKVGFFGTRGVARPALSYSRSGAGETAAGAAIRSALATLGLVTDSTTA